MSDHTHGTHEVGEIPPANTGLIWRTFVILSVITAFEFTLAYFMKAGGFRTSIFVLMTLVKAFYIVGEFMHLKHEVKKLDLGDCNTCNFYRLVAHCIIDRRRFDF